jgi:polyphenol oxidase
MITVTINGLSALQFENLSSFPEIIHFSTTRSGGCSTGNYSSLNLGLNSGDAPENVLANRILLSRMLGIGPNMLLFPKQTHTATVKVVTGEYFKREEEERRNFLNETDAIVTNIKGICVAVKTADCVPVLLFDPIQKVVAAVHAGWRGTAQNIVLETIKKLVQEFDSNPSDLLAGIGPSIGPEVYEVGKEVWSQFSDESYTDTYPVKTEKRLLDLWKTNHQQMRMAGISSNNIAFADICTWSDKYQFYSARRDGPKTGRMATGIMLR